MELPSIVKHRKTMVEMTHKHVFMKVNMCKVLLNGQKHVNFRLVGSYRAMQHQIFGLESTFLYQRISKPLYFDKLSIVTFSGH